MKGLHASLLGASFVCLPAAMLGQAESTASVTNTMPGNNFGFNLPTHVGSLAYSLTGSELIETGYGTGSVYASSVISGNLAYLSKSEQAPFSLVYSGGVVFTGRAGNFGYRVLPEPCGFAGLPHALVVLCGVRRVQLSAWLSHYGPLRRGRRGRRRSLSGADRPGPRPEHPHEQLQPYFERPGRKRDLAGDPESGPRGLCKLAGSELHR